MSATTPEPHTHDDADAGLIEQGLASFPQMALHEAGQGGLYQFRDNRLENHRLDKRLPVPEGLSDQLGQPSHAR